MKYPHCHMQLLQLTRVSSVNTPRLAHFSVVMLDLPLHFSQEAASRVSALCDGNAQG
jgi:hypothetical protein